jgi:hypothetical protein
MLKQKQFDLVLHRKGMVSPYDYTYPRLTSMSQTARSLHERHIAPLLPSEP